MSRSAVVPGAAGSDRIRIAIVDPEPLVRHRVERACSDHGAWEVVASTGDGLAAWQSVKDAVPEVLLLDPDVRGLDGFSLIRCLRAIRPDLRVVAFTSAVDDYTRFRLRQAGVGGLIDKRTADTRGVVRALATMARRADRSPGGSVRPVRRGSPVAQVLECLTVRERAVLILIGLGLNNHEIGEQLAISPDTSERHRSTLLRKLRLHRTPKLMGLARQLGFTRVPPRGGGAPAYP